MWLPAFPCSQISVCVLFGVRGGRGGWSIFIFFFFWERGVEGVKREEILREIGWEQVWEGKNKMWWHHLKGIRLLKMRPGGLDFLTPEQHNTIRPVSLSSPFSLSFPFSLSLCLCHSQHTHTHHQTTPLFLFGPLPSLWETGLCELINLRFSYTADASIPATAKAQSKLAEFIN